MGQTTLHYVEDSLLAFDHHTLQRYSVAGKQLEEYEVPDSRITQVVFWPA